MTVDGQPNTRVCVTPVARGRSREGSELPGSLDRDLMRVTDKLGGPFTPPGFYYKTFIRPRKLWPLYEKVLRGAAGLGKLDPHGRRSGGSRSMHEHVDVLVVGGGGRGSAAIAAARRGERVIVVDEGPAVGGALLADRKHARAASSAERRRGRRRCSRPAVAIGLFEQGFVPVAHGDALVKLRA